MEFFLLFVVLIIIIMVLINIGNNKLDNLEPEK